jgi:hypothetical protein
VRADQGGRNRDGKKKGGLTLPPTR